ncbi:hypothetical protein [Candidatus Poriferisodalis sp.]|uniref:hypothetical protein n=1 Tax=Candidatus Poriferisodalis sp. TaxID=3101277 RepID=UPI003B01D58E
MSDAPAERPNPGFADAPAEIICVDCGGRCGLLSFPEPDWGFCAGDVVAYRCGDCGDRWDIVLEDSDSTE